MCAVPHTFSRYETGDPPFSAEMVCGALHWMACEAMADAEALPIAAYEEEADPAVLARDVRALTERAIQVVDLATEHYESLPPSSLRGVELAALDGGLEGEVERRLERPAGVEKITSIAFVARLAMRARLQAIAALELPARRWELIAAAGGATREIVRSLGAFDAALCEHEGIRSEARPGRREELERALAIRRAYVIFRHDLVTDRPDDLRLRLRRAGTGIAQLFGTEVYPFMRVADRCALRQLQRRILAWLRGAPHAGDDHATEGARIFQDLVSLADLLLNINKREELVEHDRRALAEAAELCGWDQGAMLARLQAVRGRDAELDALLASPAGVPMEAWRAAVAQLEDQLEQRDSCVTPALGAAAGNDFLVVAWPA